MFFDCIMFLKSVITTLEFCALCCQILMLSIICSIIDTFICDFIRYTVFTIIRVTSLLINPILNAGYLFFPISGISLLDVLSSHILGLVYNIFLCGRVADT